jgi:ribosomal protein S18 acetylase RimI-like enzyme
MTTGYVIRRAIAEELPTLVAIEHEAGLRFDDIPALAGLPEVTTPPGAFERAQRDGQVWVAVTTSDDSQVATATVVGFAYTDILEGALHLEELDVLPAWGRRGIGRALVETVVADARARMLSAVTLTTFRDVPWNAPFYARLGFRVLDSGELTPGLVKLFAHEEGRGLPRALRVVMRRAV